MKRRRYAEVQTFLDPDDATIVPVTELDRRRAERAARVAAEQQRNAAVTNTINKEPEPA